MSRFSRSEAEAAGWQLVHEEDGVIVRFEKMVSNGKVEQSGITMGLALEAINAYEEHLGSKLEPVPADVDEAGMPVDEDGYVVRTVLAPNGEELTEAEWIHRGGVRDAHIGSDGEMKLEGSTPAAEEAEQARLDIAREKENERTAEPDVGPTKVLDQDSRDRQLAERLIVREDEDSLPEVIDRKLEESADAEAERSAAGIGIGPMDLDEDGNLVHPGGRSELFVPEGFPGAVDSAEEVIEAREEAEVDKALELRDEHGKSADKPELAGQVAEAGSEAVQELADEKVEEADEDKPESGELDGEAIDATDSARDLAEEKGVNLSQVEGSGKDGRITKSDVESKISEENDPEE